MRVVINDNLTESTKERVVRKLLDYGAYSYGIGCEGGGWSKHYNDIDGWNALLAAVERDYRDIGRMLLDKGAGTNKANQRSFNGNEYIDAWDVVGKSNLFDNWVGLLKNYDIFKERYGVIYGNKS